ncbi:RpiB/LacA/LacB family sugar-phosphate isomerase [archaeon]|jgi:ribose 5-phosphate isomerase B|nr:RpiB/LacA/LacB family sugar-phosphate isomerase [archaeon]MBT6762093.1 RpiB/LacA/LacB family sugar-phosphate isomerase [archaeon]
MATKKTSKTSDSLVRLYIGADHRGFNLKEQIKESLLSKNVSFIDCGDITYKKNDDYPVYAAAVAENVSHNSVDGYHSKGILICGSAEGMCIAANKFKWIRAAIVENADQTKLAVQHDHANIICLPANTLKINNAKKIIDAFLKAKPSKATRHVRRIKKILKIEKQNFK